MKDQMNMQNQWMQQGMGYSNQMMNMLLGAHGQFNNPAMGRQIGNMAQQSARGLAQANNATANYFGSSPAAFRQAQGYSNQLGGIGARIGGYANQMGQFVNQMGAIQNQMGGIQNQMGGIQNRMGQDINRMNAPINLMGRYGRQMGDAVGRLSGYQNQMGGLGKVMGKLDPRIGTTIRSPKDFSFDPTKGMLNQTMQAATQYAGNARNSALENQALDLNKSGDALNAMLAGRGLGRGSGVAAGALTDLLAQGNQSRTQLQRDLASMQQEAALGALAQDNSNILALGEMGSQYNMGLQNVALGKMGLQQQAQQQTFGNRMSKLGGQAELIGNRAGMAQAQAGIRQGQAGIAGQQAALRGQQAGLRAGQAGIAAQRAGIAANRAGIAQGRAGIVGQQAGLQQARAGLVQQQFANTMGIQGARDQRMMQANAFRNAALTSPVQMLQGIYQQNHIAPQMQILGQMNPTGFMSNIMNSGQNMVNTRAAGAAAAGQGFGDIFGGLIGNLSGNPALQAQWDQLLGRGGGMQPGGYGGMPGFGVGYQTW